MHEQSTGLDMIELLRGLAPLARAALVKQCVWRRYQAGEEIVAREDDSSDVLFIAEGVVQIADYAPSGREVAYADVQAGGHVGELSAIDGLPRSAAIIARTNCLIAQLSRPAFIRLIEDEAGVALALLRRLTAIIRSANVKVTELSTIGAMQRVYREVQRLTIPDPDNAHGAVINNLPTQETLAARLGTTRETVARVLSQLARAKITQRRGRTLYINDMDQLDALADPDGDLHEH